MCKIYSVSTFQTCNTVLLTAVTCCTDGQKVQVTSYKISPSIGLMDGHPVDELTHFVTGNLYVLTIFTHLFFFKSDIRWLGIKEAKNLSMLPAKNLRSGSSF